MPIHLKMRTAKCLQYHVFSPMEKRVYKGVKQSHDLKVGFWLAESHRSRDFLRTFFRVLIQWKVSIQVTWLEQPIRGQNFPDPTTQISISSFQTLIPNSLLIFLPSAKRWVGKNSMKICKMVENFNFYWPIGR